VKGVAQLLDSDDASDDTSDNGHQRFSPKRHFWIVTEHVPGSSLKEFVSLIHRGGFTILQAIQLSQNLITIIKRMHSRGVLLLNLEPKNIIIDWDSKKTSIDRAQLTLINFSQARIKSDKSCQRTTDCWYKAPQADVESFEYSSTIDASSICAILLWLLTNIDPRNDHDLLPHERQDVENKINRKITEEIRTASMYKQ
jgi:serine/threonine protein kinase